MTSTTHGREAAFVQETWMLRYDPEAPPSRPLDVVLDGKPAGTATILDAYANTAVRRAWATKEIQADAPPPEPSPSPLRMRNFKRNE